MSVTRWMFRDMDTNETAYVRINPNKMDSPTTARNLNFAQGTRYGAARIRGFETPPSTPATWTFGGVILTQDHYDMLQEWSDRDVVLRVTDHLERTFEIIIESFDVIERLPTMTRDWRADFTMNCLLLGEV